MGVLVEIIALVKEMPEGYLQETLEKLKEIKEKADAEEEKSQACPHCKSQKVVRNGRQNKKQSYLCQGCGKRFVSTSRSAIQNSHSSATVWKQVISDTVNGIPIDKTAKSLDLHHETVFNMRHKILYCVEQSMIANPTELTGVSESTVVLCDGKQRYNALEEKCTVAVTKRINKANGFHSFIKKKLLGARGVATIYLNRYNALFSKVYAADNSVVDDIFELMTQQSGEPVSISHTQSSGLLGV